MDNKKFEQLIDLIINENEEKASELFHEIVVEKSRQIYESIMDEEMMSMEEGMDEGMDEGGMGGQVGDLLDEINAEESGMTEDEEESAVFDLSGDEQGDMSDEESAHHDIEDRVVRVEDKLDELMAEFEELMGKEHDDKDAEFDDEAEEAGEEETHDLEDEHDEEDEEDLEEGRMCSHCHKSPCECDDDEDEDMDESVMENVNLPKVPGVKHGDDGANAKSPTLHEPRVKAEGVKPVKYNQGGDEAVPTSPKKPSNAYSKGEGNLPGAGNFANTPGKNNFAIKGQSAPKPKHGDDGSNKKSPVATK